MTFTLYADSGCVTATGVGGSGLISASGGIASASYSAAATPSATGLYYWRASYAGDTNNNNFTTGCTDANEQIKVVYNVIGFPGTKSSYRAGSAITGSFTLANATRTPIPSTQAQTIATNWPGPRCSSTAPLRSVPHTTPRGKTPGFAFSIPTTKTTAKGTHTITLTVYAGTTLLTTSAPAAVTIN